MGGAEDQGCLDGEVPVGVEPCCPEVEFVPAEVAAVPAGADLVPVGVDFVPVGEDFVPVAAPLDGVVPGLAVLRADEDAEGEGEALGRATPGPSRPGPARAAGGSPAPGRRPACRSGCRPW